MWRRRVHGRRAWLAGAAVLLCVGTTAAAAGGLLGEVVGVAGAAVGFGTGGGGSTGNVTFTTSTTHHTTYTRVDLPDVQAYQTTVLAYLHGLGPDCAGTSLAFQQNVADAFGSAAGQAAVAQATAALQAGGAASIPGPTPVASSTSSHTDFLGNQTNHTEQTVTTTASLGPGTILIGDDQSQTFFVQAGTTNYNTNTHTETFMDQRYQRTNTLSQTYQLDANVACTGATDPADRARGAQPVAAGQAVTAPAPAPAAPAPAPAPPVVAQPKTTG